jgi:hypothetical protein
MAATAPMNMTRPIYHYARDGGEPAKILMIISMM